MINAGNNASWQQPWILATSVLWSPSRYYPWLQGSWGQPGAHLGSTEPRWAHVGPINLAIWDVIQQLDDCTCISIASTQLATDILSKFLLMVIANIIVFVRILVMNKTRLWQYHYFHAVNKHLLSGRFRQWKCNQAYFCRMVSFKAKTGNIFSVESQVRLLTPI